MTKMQRLLVPLIAGVLLMGGTASALATGPEVTPAEGCDHQGDAQGEQASTAGSLAAAQRASQFGRGGHRWLELGE